MGVGPLGESIKESKMIRCTFIEFPIVAVAANQ